MVHAASLRQQHTTPAGKTQAFTDDNQKINRRLPVAFCAEILFVSAEYP